MGVRRQCRGKATKDLHRRAERGRARPHTRIHIIYSAQFLGIFSLFPIHQAATYCIARARLCETSTGGWNTCPVRSTRLPPLTPSSRDRMCMGRGDPPSPLAYKIMWCSQLLSRVIHFPELPIASVHSFPELPRMCACVWCLEETLFSALRRRG